jgi:hypothetical protein
MDQQLMTQIVNQVPVLHYGENEREEKGKKDGIIE